MNPNDDFRDHIINCTECTGDGDGLILCAQGGVLRDLDYASRATSWQRRATVEVPAVEDFTTEALRRMRVRS